MTVRKKCEILIIFSSYERVQFSCRLPFQQSCLCRGVAAIVQMLRGGLQSQTSAEVAERAAMGYPNYNKGPDKELLGAAGPLSLMFYSPVLDEQAQFGNKYTVGQDIFGRRHIGVFTHLCNNQNPPN